jgi:chemotaxis protein CheD
MFSFPGKPPVLKIGDRNAEAVEVELKRLGVPLLISDVGGSFGRTIHFNVGTGELKVRTINHGEKVI